MKSLRLAPIAALLAAALFAAGCANTVRGVGKDLGNTKDAAVEAGEDVAN